jgi:hypothetical protein
MAIEPRKLLALAAVAVALEPEQARRSITKLRDWAREAQARDPMGAAVITVLLGSLGFYLVERGRNPKVTSIQDALVYVSTNLSVGYSDIFARTPMGKLIGSALMTWGPALAAAVFDPPRSAVEGPPDQGADVVGVGAVGAGAEVASAESLALQRATLERLDAILVELRERGASPLPRTGEV